MAQGKTLTLGEDADYKIVQQTTASAASIEVGNAESKQSKLTTAEVQIQDGTNVTKLVPNKVQAGTEFTYLSGTVTDGLQIANGVTLNMTSATDGDCVLTSNGSKLTVVRSFSHSHTVGGKEGRAELKFVGGDTNGHSGYIPILDSNHMIPTEYLSNALAFDGKLKFRRFIYLKYDNTEVDGETPNKWILDTSSMVAATDDTGAWYDGAKAELDTGATGSSPATDKYWNYLFATGSYFVVIFSSTATSSTDPIPPKPFNIRLDDLFTLLSDGGYTSQYYDDQGDADNWYSTNFSTFSQGEAYKVSHSDMLVVRNAGYNSSSQTPWASAIEITVVDNSDEFQARLASETQVHFPKLTNASSPTTDTLIVKQNEVLVNANTGDGKIRLSSAGSGDNAILLETTGGSSQLDIESANQINLTSTGNTAVTAANFEVSASGTTNKAVDISTSSSSGGVYVLSGTQGTAVESSGKFNVNVYNTYNTGPSQDNSTAAAGTGVDVQSSYYNNDAIWNATTSKFEDGSENAQTPDVRVKSSHGGVGVHALKRFTAVSEINADDAVRLVSKSGGFKVDAASVVDVNANGNITIDNGNTTSGNITIHNANAATGTTGGKSTFSCEGGGGVQVAASGGVLDLDGNQGITATADSNDIDITATQGDVNTEATEGNVTTTAGANVSTTANTNVSTTATNGSVTTTAGSGVSTTATTGNVSTTASEGNVSTTATAGTVTVTSGDAGVNSMKLDCGGNLTMTAVSNALLNSTGANKQIDITADQGRIIIKSQATSSATDGDRDIQLLTSAGSLYLSAGEAKEDAIYMSAGNGSARLIAHDTLFGLISGNNSSVSLGTNAVLAVSDCYISGVAKSSVDNIGGLAMQLIPPSLGSASDSMYFVQLRIVAKDGNTTAGSKKQAYATVNLVYKYAYDGSTSPDHSVAVESYYINGPMAIKVGTYDPASTLTSYKGALRIFTYWTDGSGNEGTAGIDFEEGGNWSVNYSVMQNFDASRDSSAMMSSSSNFRNSRLVGVSASTTTALNEFDYQQDFGYALSESVTNFSAVVTANSDAYALSNGQILK